ncbi:TetR/AcrR family transcriptional regulator [Rhodococcus sp. PAMC28707]|uniref:TetR/AcrR family transcriptional regulator n=1 Tax=unclassified Rhodococcus (in: high G+C Gram-positive bacteria) TaxID=192944 RepID=UPI00109E01BB|nr:MULTISPECIES: TetR/AcrR family transcriptional regulator [unclassified Rhodococcus (in: high G+C Gram-positive bacteria)]QCB49927.1 TetR/AcrR family transcriptional regulator [Rhodococcus sp. PAMC28705]QCB58380.1 TetR/AcrR family transcriptional regulator [Rhodococcus sp. PAMC28707]
MNARIAAQRSLSKGDARRTALLAALDDSLREVDSVESINVADLSRRAGVTRSAFYFYFENKAAAVGALMEVFYEEAAEAGVWLTDVSRDPTERIGKAVSHLFTVTERHEHLYRAVLEARATNPSIRTMWEADRVSFEESVAEMIEAERAAGRAPDGVDARTLAAVLLDVNDRNMERRVVGSRPDHDLHVEVVTSIWVRSIYGTHPLS